MMGKYYPDSEFIEKPICGDTWTFKVLEGGQIEDLMKKHYDTFTKELNEKDFQDDIMTQSIKNIPSDAKTDFERYTGKKWDGKKKVENIKRMSKDVYNEIAKAVLEVNGITVEEKNS